MLLQVSVAECCCRALLSMLLQAETQSCAGVLLQGAVAGCCCRVVNQNQGPSTSNKGKCCAGPKWANLKTFASSIVWASLGASLRRIFLFLHNVRIFGIRLQNPNRLQHTSIASGYAYNDLYLKPRQVPRSPEANRSQAKVIPRPSWWRHGSQGCGSGAGWSRHLRYTDDMSSPQQRQATPALVH